MRFVERLEHPPTLALIRYLASLSSLPIEVDHIGEDGLRAVKGMALVNRGRLSELRQIHSENPSTGCLEGEMTELIVEIGVQPVDEDAYEAVISLGRKGGWESLVPGAKKAVKGKDAERESGEPNVEGSSKEEGKKTLEMGRKQSSGAKARPSVEKEVSNSVIIADDADTKISRKATKRASRDGVKADGDHLHSAQRKSKRTKR